MPSSAGDPWFHRLRDTLRDLEPPVDVPNDRYEILTRAGEGGMAEVYVAHDRQLGRRVALKVLKESLGSSEELLRRFEREARVMARLSHPNLVGVLDACERAGRPCLVMEYIAGEPLSLMLQRRRFEPREMVALVMKVARGVQHAHAHGIVHRDLKPANILVTETGEPKVGDFGLAHIVASSNLTGSGRVLGTPLYMAPEQVDPKVGAIGPHTDVYALGAILYEVLTGRPPHVADTPPALYRMILQDEVVPPRRRGERVAGDLEAICLKALERPPSARYRNAGDLADDLERHLQGVPVEARPVRVSRRLALRVAAAAVVVAAGLGGWLAVRVAWRGGQVREALAEAGRHERAGELEPARLAFERARSIDGGDLEARVGLARVTSVIEERRRAASEAATLVEQARFGMERVQRLLYDRASGAEYVASVALECLSKVETALERAPDLAAARYLEGRACLALGDWTRAEAALRKAIELDPAIGGARFELARVLMLEGVTAQPGEASLAMSPRESRLVEARDHLAQLAKEGTADGVAPLLAAATALSAWVKGDAAQARRVVDEELARLGGRGAEDLHWVRALASGEPEAARAVESALAACPRHVPSLVLRALARRKQGDLSGAVADLDTCIAVSPRCALLYVWRAWVRCNGGALAAAKADLAEAMRLAPEHPGAHFTLGQIHVAEGKHDDALRAFDEAVRLLPDTFLVYFHRGNARRNLGDRPGAVADYDRALTLTKDARELLGVHVQRGSLQLDMGQFDAALWDFSRAIEAEPSAAIAHYNRGTLLGSLGRWTEARPDLEKAHSLEPANVSILHNLGAARRNCGDAAGAVRALDEALRLSPLMTDAYVTRSRARRDLQDYEGALKDCDRALELDAARLETHLERAEALRLLGRLREAEAAYTLVILRDAGQLIAYTNRGNVRESLGDAEGAMADYESALTRAPKDWPHRAKIERHLATLKRRPK